MIALFPKEVEKGEALSYTDVLLHQLRLRKKKSIRLNGNNISEALTLGSLPPQG